MASLTGMPRASAILSGWRTGALTCAMVVILGCVSVASAAASATLEYQIKAVFLFNFAQFVAWPSAAFDSAEQPISICILGEDPFGNYLDETVRGESVGKRPLVIHRYRQVEEMGPCHLLYVSRSESERVGDIVTQLKGRSILTVSDADSFADRGGMIRLETRNKRIKLRINLDAARAAGLTISSKLLRPAQIVATKVE